MRLRTLSSPGPPLPPSHHVFSDPPPPATTGPERDTESPSDGKEGGAVWPGEGVK